jgi:RNA polymerase sigma-70 factor, ECF subfamily
MTSGWRSRRRPASGTAATSGTAALRGGMTWLGAWRVLATAANGQPAAAGYLRRPGESAFLPFVISVLDIASGELADIAAFEAPGLISAFGLPAFL